MNQQESPEQPSNPSGELTSTAPAGTISLTALLTEKSGDTIGRYKLLQRIGEGGMGSVWVAEQMEPVRRQVAIKLIKLGMDSDQVLARFEAERQALALMDHPNIAKVFDAGATCNGRPFFVMELVRGTPLTRFCDEQRLSIRERLELFVPVCHAVQHAHQKGIIHRDLKPGNVLVAQYDGRPVPKVIDFGIAKATGPRLTERTLFTGFGTVVGTLEYMSPEQAELNQLDIDTRSDIYSLGVLLYELLTGTTPLTREALGQAAFDEILRRIRNEEPPKPSTRLSQSKAHLASISAQRKLEPAQLTNLVRGDLDWIVMKTLAKDRACRYETANGLAADIKRHLADEPVMARPPSLSYRCQKTVRRHKLAFIAASAVSLSLVIGLGLSMWLFFKEKDARRRADGEANKSEQVARFLENMLNGVSPEVAQGEDTRLLQKILDQTTRNLEHDLKELPEVEAELKEVIGHVYVVLGLYEKAEAIQREALRLLRDKLGRYDADTATALNLLATTLYFQGRLPEAEKLQREALELRLKLFGKENTNVAESLNDLSLVLKDERKLDEAERMQYQALAMSRKLLGADHPNVSASLNNLAEMLREQGKLDEAERLQREDLQLTRRRSNDVDTALSLNNLALLLRDERKLGEAEAAANEALTMRKRVLGLEHPDVAVSLDTLGRILMSEGKLPEAESLIGQGLAIRRKALTNQHPDLAISLQDLADVLKRQFRLDEVEPLVREALEIREKNNANDWETSDARSDLGGVLLEQKKWSEAEPLLLSGYEGLKQRQQTIPLADQSRLPEAARRLVHLYEATGQGSKLAEWRARLQELQKPGAR